jgi:hypothetical protein
MTGKCEMSSIMRQNGLLLILSLLIFSTGNLALGDVFKKGKAISEGGMGSRDANEYCADAGLYGWPYDPNNGKTFDPSLKKFKCLRQNCSKEGQVYVFANMGGGVTYGGDRAFVINEGAQISFNTQRYTMIAESQPAIPGVRGPIMENFGSGFPCCQGLDPEPQGSLKVCTARAYQEAMAKKPPAKPVDPNNPYGFPDPNAPLEIDGVKCKLLDKAVQIDWDKSKHAEEYSITIKPSGENRIIKRRTAQFDLPLDQKKRIDFQVIIIGINKVGKSPPRTQSFRAIFDPAIGAFKCKGLF